MIDWKRQARFLGVAMVMAAIGFAAPAMAQDPNECDTLFDSPDVIVGDLQDIQRYGAMDGKTSFSIGTTSCNVGTCWLNWFSNVNQHPVIGQSAFRLKDGRYEQIGMGWLKHGFFALSEDLCSTECISTNGDHLGVNCSDPYTAGLNGNQGGLGPRFQVNAFTGDYPYPFFAQNQTGNLLYKRVQLDHNDIDSALNPGARYWVQGLYVTPDDASAGNGENNASHREVNVLGSNGFYDLQFAAPVVQSRPAIFAWPLNDTGVLIRSTRIPNEGLFWVASKATDLGNGYHHYEYAVQNLNSDRSGQSFRIELPLGADVTNIGFHDVDYHSGEVQEGTDWAVTLEQGTSTANYIQWSTEDHGVNPNANALRWGTLYNFRFDADVAPDSVDAEIGLWIPGTPNEVTVGVNGPSLCDGDGVCELGEDCDTCSDCTGGGSGECCGDNICDPSEDSCSCAADCGAPQTFEASCNDGEDDDCDGAVDCADDECCGIGSCGTGSDTDGDTYTACVDCDDTNVDIWLTPGEVINLLADQNPATQMSWDSPLDPGGNTLDYVMLRSVNPADFLNGAVCMTTSGNTATEPDTPVANEAFYYLVYGENECPIGKGTAGSGTDGARAARDCP